MIFIKACETAVWAAGATYKRAVETYRDAQTNDETKAMVQGALRTTAGVYSIYYAPVTAGAVGIAASFRPELAATAVKIAEGTLTGLWNSMDVEKKAIVVTGCIGLSYVLPSSVALLGTVIAAKMGAELAVRNVRKEQLTLQQAAAEEL